MGREFGFPFFGEITEAVPGNLGAGNRAAESDLFFINPYNQPVTFARAVLDMYFLSRSKGESFEEKDCFVHYFFLGQRGAAEGVKGCRPGRVLSREGKDYAQ